MGLPLLKCNGQKPFTNMKTEEEEDCRRRRRLGKSILAEGGDSRRSRRMDEQGSYSCSRLKSGSSKNIGSIQERDPKNCYCGIPWVARTSNTEANPGRRFRRCSLSKVSPQTISHILYELNSFSPMFVLCSLLGFD